MNDRSRIMWEKKKNWLEDEKEDWIKKRKIILHLSEEKVEENTLKGGERSWKS